MRRVKRRSVIKAGLLFGAAIGALAAFACAMPRPKPLLAQSRRVFGAEKNSEPLPQYAWLDDKRFLLRGTPPFRVYTLDVASSKKFNLPELAEEIADTEKEADYGGPFEVSPDGKRVAWQIGSSASRVVYSATLQGEQIGWQRGIEGEGYAWEDNEKLLLFGYGMSTPANTYERNEFDCIGVITKHPDSDDYILYSPEIKAQMTQPFLFARGHKFYTMTDAKNEEKLGSATLFQWNIGEMVTPDGKFTVHFPPGDYFKQAALSPQGDQIAWLVRRDYVSPFQRFITKFFHRSFAPQAQEEILVSRVDGSEMRTIGAYEITPADRTREDNPLDNARWLPGGRQLSFEHDNALWTVPAP